MSRLGFDLICPRFLKTILNHVPLVKDEPIPEAEQAACHSIVIFFNQKAVNSWGDNIVFGRGILVNHAIRFVPVIPILQIICILHALQPQFIISLSA